VKPPAPNAAGGAYFERDTDATAFTRILEELLDGVSGSYAAALVDSLGETVDYAGRGDPFDIRIAAAHLQLILRWLTTFGALGEPRWIVVKGAQKSLAATALPDGYALALLLRSRSAFNISTRAVAVCLRALADEAGWAVPVSRDGVARSWFPVTVDTDRRGRPIRVYAKRGTITVEVLGALMGLAVRERGFRVRTSDGTELNLVREARRRWYADEPL
jgi:hypothetical protein